MCAIIMIEESDELTIEVQCCTVQYSTVLRSTKQCSAVKYSTVLAAHCQLWQDERIDASKIRTYRLVTAHSFIRCKMCNITNKNKQHRSRSLSNFCRMQLSLIYCSM